ncbi:Vascular endothelial growth factor receptor 1 [Folsomia candida]|uniref:Vascular endothelial growth factor receptor 1 n=1 Tax=Folsomia candida TaxID=158441 RepID=A0A226E4X4_FOLCA|nr:Vascular endothelial growth factor receptor 1 [Folsomia candida]
MKLFERENHFHPCCGFDLNSVVPKVIPVVQFAIMKLGLIFLILGIFQNWDSLQQDKVTNVSSYHLVRLICWGGYGIHIIVNDSFLLLLWKGCHSKNPSLVRVWVVATPISIIWVVIMMLINISRLRWVSGVSSPQIFVLVAFYGVLQCYFVYVVYFYMKEMEVDIFMSSTIRSLTDAEVAEFEQGISPPFRVQDLDTETQSLMDRIHYERYKKEDFEIERNKLQFDMDNPLGSGDYGKVYKGLLQPADGTLVTVAVKTVNPESADVICFKALLTELKVWTYLGSHPNLVGLLGACTTEIRDRTLLIVSEFCALGNLHCLLVGCRGLFCNFVNNNGILQTSTLNTTFTTEHVSTLDLIRWSREIASGMEYLESLRVVHGDLATRNILLTSHKAAKLTDFGLARQLYNYSVYVKKQNTPLPWRWLSLESLADMTFSSKSDVWSYAVTLSEIFTLGEIPYPGHQFCLEFVYDLKAGLRPNKPRFVPQEIWALMERCWKKDAKIRPTFSEIVQIFANIYDFSSDSQMGL